MSHLIVKGLVMVSLLTAVCGISSPAWSAAAPGGDRGSLGAEVELMVELEGGNQYGFMLPSSGYAMTINRYPYAMPHQFIFSARANDSMRHGLRVDVFRNLRSQSIEDWFTDNYGFMIDDPTTLRTRSATLYQLPAVELHKVRTPQSPARDLVAIQVDSYVVVVTGIWFDETLGREVLDDFIGSFHFLSL